MPACEGDSCSAPNSPGLHTISARSPCAAIRQCPVPSHPLSPVYPQLQAPAAGREKLVLGGHLCWKVKKLDIDTGKSLDVLREMQTRARCGSCFEYTEGWLSLSNRTVVIEPAWGLSQLVDPEALPIPWVRAAQSLPRSQCVQEINSDTCCLLPALVSAGSNMETEQKAAMCSGQDDSTVGRWGSSVNTKAGICPQPGHSLDVPDPFTMGTCVPQGMGKILKKQWGEVGLEQLRAQGDLMVLQFHVLTFLNSNTPWANRWSICLSIGQQIIGV